MERYLPNIINNFTEFVIDYKKKSMCRNSNHSPVEVKKSVNGTNSYVYHYECQHCGKNIDDIQNLFSLR